jgi:hypothetical protein
LPKTTLRLSDSEGKVLSILFEKLEEIKNALHRRLSCQIHGSQDQFQLSGALNNTWEWLENDWTLLTAHEAGHFVQHDAADLVTRSILDWLAR